MHNQPFSQFDDRFPDQPLEDPRRRLLVLTGLAACCFVGIGIRVVSVQAGLSERFISTWRATTTEEETLPSRSGRILSRDGVVLARDEARYDVFLHYRWLESPPDPLWLRREVLQRLAPRERNDTSRQAAIEKEIRSERDRLWGALAEVTGLAGDDLRGRAAEIQQRIESMSRAVNERRAREQDLRGPAPRGVRLELPLPGTKGTGAIAPSQPPVAAPRGVRPELPLPGTKGTGASAPSQPPVAAPRGVGLELLLQGTKGTGAIAPGQPPVAAGWRGVYEALKTELTTPPVRQSGDRVILREELEDHLLVGNVPLATAAAIQSQPSRFPGVRIRSSTARVYPLDDFAAHVIGFRRQRPNSDGTLETRPESGIERAWNRRLSGRSGLLRRTLDRRGNLLQSETVRPPRDGRDVTLTIDSRLQRKAESLLDAALDGRTDGAASRQPIPTGGALVAIDLWTGDVLAAADAPRHSLKRMHNPDPEEWDRLLADPRRPFFPRVSRMALPPGSVFKVITAVAALESGEASPEELIHCRGYLDRPDRFRCLVYRRHGLGHGAVNLEGALCQSCNVFFYELARRTGPEALGDWARRFGFGQRTGSDLPQEQPGTLPVPNDPFSEEKWYPGSTLQLAIGQGSLLVTPLQVVRMMAAVGNGGYLVSPRVVVDAPPDEHETAGNGARPARMQKIAGLSERTLTTLRQGLEMVVHHPRGTGKPARVEGITLAGKTGTAEVSGQEDHAWFAGYAPARSPRIAFVVVLEHGGSGGEAAGGIVRELVSSMLEYGYLRGP